MNTKMKVVASTATIALALVVAPKPTPHVEPTKPALTCYSNESACDLINPTNETVRYDPCETEDQSTPCYWDASTRGNGQGRSFIVTTTGRTVYVP